MIASKTRRALLALAAFLVAAPAFAAEWQDNAIGYRWGYNFREPGVVDANGKPKDVAKSIVSFTHVDGWKYGGNFLTFDYLTSTKADPAVGGAGGAAEFYLTYRTDLSLNKLSGGKTFSFGPVRDVNLEAGVDLNTKNTSFASRKVMPAIGPVVAFDVPGFLNVGVLAVREFNNNGIVGKNVVFDTTAMVSASWGIPIGPATFAGFGNVVLPKGKDGFGAKTKTEVLLHPKILVDVGSFWGWKHAVEAGVGYEYWLNKFGNDNSKVKGSLANTPFLEVAAHL
jgi:nucleoside-specific outer membrane channel protein Tsx